MSSIKKFIYCVVVLVVLSKTNGRRNFEIFLDNCACISNPIYIESCTCQVVKTVIPPVGFFEVNIVKQLNEIFLSFYVFIVKKNNEKLSFLNSTDNNLCEIFQPTGIAVIPLIKIFKEFLTKVGYLPEKCPIEKGKRYSFENITIDPEKFPPYVPDARFGAYLNFTMGKELLAFVEIYGDTVNKSNKRWIKKAKT